MDGSKIVWNVDTQIDFMNDDGTLSVPNARNIVGNLSSIFKSAVSNGVRILGSADEHTDASAEFEKNGGVFPPHCVRYTKGQLNIPETFLGKGNTGIARWHESYAEAQLAAIFSKKQVILTKDDNDVFTSPHIAGLLKTVPKGAEIYLTGVATEYCDACALRGLVKYSAENGMEWKISVVADAIKEITEEGRIAAFEEFRKLGISFVKTADVIRQLEGGHYDSALKEAARKQQAKSKVT